MPNKVLYDYVGDAVPQSPTHGETWLETAASYREVWRWNGSLSVWETTSPLGADHNNINFIPNTYSCECHVTGKSYFSGYVLESLEFTLLPSADNTDTKYWKLQTIYRALQDYFATPFQDTKGIVGGTIKTYTFNCNYKTVNRFVCDLLVYLENVGGAPSIAASVVVKIRGYR